MTDVIEALRNQIANQAQMIRAYLGDIDRDQAAISRLESECAELHRKTACAWKVTATTTDRSGRRPVRAGMPANV